jgi:hypothetical protein
MPQPLSHAPIPANVFFSLINGMCRLHEIPLPAIICVPRAGNTGLRSRGTIGLNPYQRSAPPRGLTPILSGTCKRSHGRHRPGSWSLAVLTEGTKFSQKQAGVPMNFIQITPFMYVHDLERALAFFNQILGFETLFRTRDYAYVQRETAGIRILEQIGEDAAPPNSPDCLLHRCSRRGPSLH